MEGVEPLEAFLICDPARCGVWCSVHYGRRARYGNKGSLMGGRADFVDFLLTAVGGVIGHGVMLVVGLDYLIGFLISLI